MTRSINNLSILIAVMMMVLPSMAQQEQCGDLSNATDVPSGNFSSIVVGALCDGGDDCNFLIPKEINWHIYPLESGTTPKYDMYPSGLFVPQVRNGILSYKLQNILEGTYHKGQSIQAGINLYIPIDQLETISIEGVEQYVQVHDGTSTTESIRIINHAIDTQVRISTPDWIVQYEESGVDNQVWLDVAEGSSVDVSGVDIDAYIQCPGGLSVRARGVDNDIFVQGLVSSGTLEGVDANLEINNNNDNENPCANVTNTGVANDCDNSNDLFEMDDLACLADTKVGYQCYWGWNMSTGGKIALGVVFFIALVAAISGCIICCAKGCCCRKNRNLATTQDVAPYPPTTSFPKATQNDTFKGSEEDTVQNTVMEAEVLEVKNVVTSNDNVFEDVDLEKAKGGHVSPSVY